MRDVDKMIERLLDMELVGTNNEVTFTDEAKQLIHEISEECMKATIILDNKDRMENYGRELSAEDVYVEMLICVIDQKLRKEGDE